MGRISRYIKNYLTEKHNLTVNVNENEGIVSMSQETFNEILTGYGELLYGNIFYAFMIVFTVVGFAVVILIT